MRAIGNVDDHQDETIDFRDFYAIEYNDEFDHMMDRREQINNEEEEKQPKKKNGDVYIPKDKSDKLYLEDVKIVKYHQMPSLNYDAFFKKCQKFITPKQDDKLRFLLQDVEKEKVIVFFHKNKLFRLNQHSLLMNSLISLDRVQVLDCCSSI